MSEGRPPTVRWLFGAVLGAVVLAVVAGILARQWYQGSGQSTGQASGSPPSPTETTPAPGSLTVRGTEDTVRHPFYEAVRKMLQRHFDAINARSYLQWTTTVTARRVKDTPQDRWLDDYRSTKDGSVVVYRLETVDARQARALIQLVSVQDPGDAPPSLQVSCIRWYVVYPLIVEDGLWRVDGGLSGASAQLEKC